MNEIMVRRYIKEVMSFGVHKVMAREIIEMAVESSKGNNIEMAIKYAIDLVYGYGFTQKEENERVVK